ncbi:response regulator [Marinobacterium lutimaris]|uniref:Response regulator receiver domain-containing protein n=1 Tax=Marinobacterium lutimaris TaxID=568106 RepID=A0A1H6BF19_9GAMM|nr:response regulator [Marinobacterium lutimaris]SEG58877.1 Response regulator receiver domain-containing protein [Marinobacterium lutimaris]
MAPPKIDYSDKNVLLVDSSGNMRSTIFYMLRELGVQNLRATTVSERVLEMIREEAFDIILLGHNSSDLVSGAQILEEARYRGYIRPTAGWIFMTSDASQELVLHAIDSRPDFLLTKPFSVEELKQRLDQLVLRKRTLFQVEQAIEIGDLEAAVDACREIPASDPCYEQAMRLRGRCLIDLGRTQQACEELERQYWKDDDKDTGLLLAEALCRLERLNDAEELLNGLIESYPLLIAAFDLLAKVHERNGMLHDARETLKEATQKAPLGIPRQMELGRVATQSKALDTAEGAYKRSIVLGRRSCFRSPEPFLRLANVRRLEMQGADERRSVELRNEFDTLLNNAEYNFPKDPALKVKSALLRGKMAGDLGEEDEVNRFQKEAQRYNQALDNPMDLAREDLVLSGDKVPLLEPQSAAAHSHVRRDQEMAAKVNRLGIKHYMAGKLSQATRYFGLAIEYDPGYPVALLNLAQLYLESARDNVNRRDERLKMVDRYLRLTQQLPLDAAMQQRVDAFKELRQHPVEELPGGSLAVLLR